MTRRRTPVGDGWIAYIDEGQGHPLLLLPGLGGQSSFWRRSWSALGEHFRLISIDQRGCGDSSRCLIDYSIPQMATDVLAVLDALDVQTADIIGHSTGGVIALWLAAHHPRRVGRLVASSTWAGPDRYMEYCFRLRERVLESLGIAAYRQFVDLMLYPPSWYSCHLEEIAARNDTTSVDAAILRRRMRAIMNFDLRPYLADIRHEVLVICPRDDRVTPLFLSEEIAAGVPRAQLCALETGGHAAPRIATDEFCRPVLRFLATHDRTPRVGGTSC
jgi:aminoacrylate hydrolase